MSNEKQLTKKTALHFMDDCDSIDLSEFTRIADPAAEALSKHQGDLYLGGLTKLSDAAAESLSNHQGLLWLQGLSEISDASAKSLSKHQGDLYIDGRKSFGLLVVSASYRNHFWVR